MKRMKQFISILLIAGFGILALVEQSKTHPNQYIMIGAMAVFMFGLFRLMKKIPSKKEDEDDTKI
jgi:inner membrane protein involved in colicin E2 resistance